MPDISTLLPLASFFGITMDELFYRNGELEEKEDLSGRISLLRSALLKYPKNFRLLRELAACLLDTPRNNLYSREEKSANLQECIEICGRIHADCMDDSIRNTALYFLVKCYIYKASPVPTKKWL